MLQAARSGCEPAVLASLNHPNIATIHGREDAGEACAIVVGPVAGPMLADRIKGRAMPVFRRPVITCQMSEAPEYAYDRGTDAGRPAHRSLFVARHEPAELKVYRFDLASGERRLCKELTPADRTGLVALGLPRVTRTGDTYVYDYSTLLPIVMWPRA